MHPDAGLTLSLSGLAFGRPLKSNVKPHVPSSVFCPADRTDWAPELAAYFGRITDDVLQTVRPWFDLPAGELRIELMDG